jgi:hypothetical protein
MKKLQFITTGKLVFTLILAGMIAIPLLILRAQSYQHVTEEEALAQQLENRIGGGWLERLRELQAQQLEGSWDVTVTPAVPAGVPQPPSFHAYASLSRGGAFFGSDRNRPFSKQHGTWTHQGGNEFAWTFREDLFDSAGAFAGILTVRARVIVTGPNEFVGVSNGEQRDAAGNLIFNRCSRIKGARIQIEPLAPQCQSLSPFQ